MPTLFIIVNKIIRVIFYGLWPEKKFGFERRKSTFLCRVITNVLPRGYGHLVFLAVEIFQVLSTRPQWVVMRNSDPILKYMCP